LTSAKKSFNHQPSDEERMKTIYTLLAMLMLYSFAFSQVTEKKSLTLDGARKVIAAAQAEARRLNAPGGVIAVVDEGGNLMALERLDGTFAAGANISIGKARTSVIFKRPTKVFEDIIKNGRTSMTTLNDFTPLQGGIPIMVDGQVVGGVGVSGAASAAQDEELAIAGAKAVGNPMMGETMKSNSPPSVTYFDKDKVVESFKKGDQLFTSSDKYMVHTSRRDKAGEAEVHAKDADIIYVQEGTATFVTGGTVVEPRAIAADETRGKEIAGGETRKLKKGDVIIVPAGTPHWFKEVPSAFTYYVVKAR
jgi:glc operon protein GlcG